MIEIGINHEPALHALITRLARDGKISLVELIVDGYRRSVSDLKQMISELGLPYSFHNVLMSIGSADFRAHDVSLTRDAVRALDPIHYSEHLTFSRAGELDLVQNLGVPMTTEMAALFARNIRHVVRSFGTRVPFLIENIATPWRFDASHLGPAEFITAIARDSGARLLLDLHNLYVDEVNHGWIAERVIDGLPLDLVDEVHVTGGSYLRGHARTYLDSHDARIPRRVWEILGYLLERRAPRAIVLERSSDRAPSARFEREVIADLAQLRTLARRASPTRRMATPMQPARATHARRRITIDSQRRWLRAVARPSQRPRMQCKPGVLRAVRAKYLKYVMIAVARVFPRFAERSPLVDDHYLEIFAGRDPLADADVDWLYPQLCRLVGGLADDRAWLDLLRVERAVAISRRDPPTRLTDAAIARRATWFCNARRPLWDIDRVHFVRVTTGMVVDFPTLRPSSRRATGEVVLAVVRTEPTGLPKILRYDVGSTR